MTKGWLISARPSRWHRIKAVLPTMSLTLLVMVPVALLGNFASEFYQQRDWVHFALAVLGAAMLLAAFWMLWPPGSRGYRQ